MLARSLVLSPVQHGAVLVYCVLSSLLHEATAESSLNSLKQLGGASKRSKTGHSGAPWERPMSSSGLQ